MRTSFGFSTSEWRSDAKTVTLSHHNCSFTVTNGVFDCSTFTRLQNLADALVDKLVSEGLMKREYDRVKLHATVMNTKQRDSPDEQTPAKKSRSDVPPRFKKRTSFDARKIITVSY